MSPYREAGLYEGQPYSNMGGTFNSGISMGNGRNGRDKAMKNTLKKPFIGSDNKRKTKTGSSTPKKPKVSPTPRFYEVKIRITAEEYDSGKPFFEELKYLPKFAVEAYREKVKRAEAADKFTRQRTIASNIKLLEPLIRELYEQGKLGFLNGK